MQLTITGRHVDITEPVKIYAGQKVRHIVNRHLPAKITKAHVIMDIQRYQQIVELELHGPHANLYSKVASLDMYTSIDKVIDKVERQLIKLKTRYDKRKHIRAPSIRVPAEE